MRRITEKTTLVLIIVLLAAIDLSAQSLERNANYIKDNYSEDYRQTIRKHAVDEWGTDHRMVVYEINKQSDSLVELIDAFKPENTNLAFQAIQKWSIDGYKSSNVKKFKEIKTFGLAQLLKLHCDWRMVLYEYDKQASAKASY